MDTSADLSAVLRQQQDQYVGQWRRLVSTTNWEKGRIITEWRAAAVQQSRRLTEYSDEAWSRLVGGVSPQHVGRLRRVYERFGDEYTTFAGLYWSHFCGALDWDDAEMWLEGAVQNRWSVSRMSRQRWETLGGDEPVESDVIDTELDEDLAVVSTAVPDSLAELDVAGLRLVSDEQEAAVPTADATPPQAPATAAAPPEDPAQSAVPAGRADALPELPQELLEALENLKVLILRYKLDGWQDVPAKAVLAHLDALKHTCEGR